MGIAAVAIGLLLSCGAKAPPRAAGSLTVTGVVQTTDGVEVSLLNDGPRRVEVFGLDIGLWDASGPAGSTETDPRLVLAPGGSGTLPVDLGVEGELVRVTGTVHTRDLLGSIELVPFDKAPHPEAP